MKTAQGSRQRSGAHTQGEGHGMQPREFIFALKSVPIKTCPSSFLTVSMRLLLYLLIWRLTSVRIRGEEGLYTPGARYLFINYFIFSENWRQVNKHTLASCYSEPCAVSWRCYWTTKPLWFIISSTCAVLTSALRASTKHTLLHIGPPVARREESPSHFVSMQRSCSLRFALLYSLQALPCQRNYITVFCSWAKPTPPQSPCCLLSPFTLCTFL